eukprot:scaffold9641_cov116-Isochrysis_galbana.AAC.1
MCSHRHVFTPAWWGSYTAAVKPLRPTPAASHPRVDALSQGAEEHLSHGLDWVWPLAAASRRQMHHSAPPPLPPVRLVMSAGAASMAQGSPNPPFPTTPS